MRISSLSADPDCENIFSQSFIFFICRVSGNQSLSSIHPGGVNICEHLELLGETDREERVKRPSHTDGRFRATCLSMSHLQCDIRVWPGPLWTSVSLSNSMRTNPELQSIYAVKARSSCPPKDVCCEGSSPHLCKPILFEEKEISRNWECDYSSHINAGRSYFYILYF